MFTFTECDKAGHNGNNLLFSLIADDGNRYEFGITPDCFVRLFAMGWKAAQHLPQTAAQQGTSPGIETQASFAVVNMQPGLALLSGPLVLSMTLDKEQIDHLRDEMNRFVAGLKQDQKH